MVCSYINYLILHSKIIQNLIVWNTNHVSVLLVRSLEIVELRVSNQWLLYKFWVTATCLLMMLLRLVYMGSNVGWSSALGSPQSPCTWFSSAAEHSDWLCPELAWAVTITTSTVFCCQMSLSLSESTVVELSIRRPRHHLHGWLLNGASWFLNSWLGTLCRNCSAVSPGLHVATLSFSNCCEEVPPRQPALKHDVYFRTFTTYNEFLMKCRK